MPDEFRPDVVAGKYDPSLFDPTGLTLLVNEIFYSLQGEGSHTGQATVFVRLAKCNLACKFCDTEFETYQVMTTGDIVQRITELANVMTLPWVVLTGGEPLLQNSEVLLDYLRDVGFKICVETSGSVALQPWGLTKIDWVTVSPKVPKDRIITGRCNEAKWIVNAAFLTQFFQRPKDFYIEGALNYLQPESNNPKWITAASKIVMANPLYRLSLQTHKYAGNP